jgi:hypothetical protein
MSLEPDDFVIEFSMANDSTGQSGLVPLVNYRAELGRCMNFAGMFGQAFGTSNFKPALPQFGFRGERHACPLERYSRSTQSHETSLIVALNLTTPLPA